MSASPKLVDIPQSFEPKYSAINDTVAFFPVGVQIYPEPTAHAVNKTVSAGIDIDAARNMRIDEDTIRRTLERALKIAVTKSVVGRHGFPEHVYKIKAWFCGRNSELKLDPWRIHPGAEQIGRFKYVTVSVPGQQFKHLTFNRVFGMTAQERRERMLAFMYDQCAKWPHDLAESKMSIDVLGWFIFPERYECMTRASFPLAMLHTIAESVAMFGEKENDNKLMKRLSLMFFKLLKRRQYNEPRSIR